MLLPIFLLSACAMQGGAHDRNSAKESEVESVKQELLHIGSVEDAFLKGRIALKENKIDLAQAYYVAAYEMEPNNLLVLGEMANLYKRINNDELLLLTYQLILEQEPDDIDILEKYGLLLIKLNKYQEAEKKLLQVTASKMGKKKWQAFNGLGIIADLADKHQKAIDYYKQAERLNPNNSEILNNIGYSLYMDNQLDEPLRYFNRALKVNPKFEMALYNYALVKARQGKYERAVQAFARVTDKPEAYNNTGYIAMRNGDHKESEFYLNEALKLSPRFYKKAYDNLQMLKAR